MKLKVDGKEVITVEAKQIGLAFANASDGEQAEMIKCIAESWKSEMDKFSSECQMWSMVEAMDRDSVDFVFKLANFCKASTVPQESPKWDWLMRTYPESV